jgi:hypothetical protein
VKLEAVLGEISEKLQMEDKFRYIVPPAVRIMNEELKQALQELLNAQYEQESKTDAEQRAFL